MKVNKGLIVATAAVMTVVAATVGAISFKDHGSFGTIRAEATAPTNTRRVWVIDNNGESASTKWWSSSTMYAHTWTTGEAVTIKLENKVIDGYYKGLWYFDVELASATTSLKVIIRVGNASAAYDWGNNNQTGTIELGALGAADTIWLNDGTWYDSGNSRNSRNSSVGTTNGFNDVDLATILGGYNTCSSTNTYGYNAYPQLETNFFAKCADEVLSSETTLPDYDYEEYVAAGKDYSKINKDHTSTVAGKIAGLEYWYNYYNPAL